MTTLAAMIDRVDQEVGRLVDDLKVNGDLDNTFLLFVSDNGACPYDRRRPQLDVEPTNGDIALGDSTGWAWARNTPFRYYKQNQFEGGISTPAIVHWPGGLKTKPGSITDQPGHLIDVLPTLADITGSSIPQNWPDRDLRPISGVSLAPAFCDEPITRKAPLHFLFSTDRGLRDGDWKAVSFRREVWELYNLADDPTELNDLAMAEPQRLQEMVEQWTRMTKDVLHGNAASYAPAIDAKLPHQHPEWTNFDGMEPNRKRRNSAAGKTKANARKIRARKNTKLQIVDGTLRLFFSGDDPGIAMDMRNRELPPGPYRVKFRLRGGGVGGGDLFFTTDPKTTLPRGSLVEFDVKADGEWQDVDIELQTSKTIHQLRIDVCDNAGEAAIADLKLVNMAGEALLAWPGEK